MKKLLIFPVLFFSLFLSAQTSEKAALTYEAKHNGVSHTIQEGDTVHLGYGSSPSGGFMYIQIGAPAQGMSSQYGGKSGMVTKVKYWKMTDQYELVIKVKGAGTYGVKIPQAVDRDEIIGLNQTYFKKN